MHVAYPVYIFLKHCKGILAGKGKVPCVVAEEHCLWIGVCHHPVGLFRSLYNGAHVMVKAKLESMRKSHPSQLAQTVAEPVPFRVVHYMFMSSGKDWNIRLSLYGITLLAYVYAVRANSRKELQFLNELFFHLFVGLCKQE